jgi:hypothetical protein
MTYREVVVVPLAVGALVALYCLVGCQLVLDFSHYDTTPAVPPAGLAAS